MADITSKMLDVRIGTSNDWAQENLSLVAGNLYYVDLMKNDNTPSGAMALFLAMGTTKADARYLTTLMPSALDASVTGDIAVGDTLVTALSKLNNKITSVANDAAQMFTIMGTIGTQEHGGSVPDIPPTAEKGDAWRIVTGRDYTLNGKTEKLEVGDWIICSFVSSDNTPTWVVLQANLDLSSVTFDGSDIEANGFVINLSGAGINASTTVPFANTSNGGLLTAADYGKLNTGNDIVYKNNTATGSINGVVTLSDSIASESNSSSGVAATPLAVKSVKDALDTATTTLSADQQNIVKGIEVDNAKHSTDSKKILVQNEAGSDFHAEIHVYAQDEGQDGDGNAIGIRLHTNDTSNKVIVNEADHSASADNLVVEGKEYSVKAVEIEDTTDIRLQSTDEGGIVSVDHADLADDLGGRQETTPEEFIYQPTAGEYTSIKDGMASIKLLKGNSVVWNQCDNMAALNNVVFRGLTYTYDSNNNILTINGTANSPEASYLYGVNYGFNRIAQGRVAYSSIEWLSGSITGGNINFIHGSSGSLSNVGIQERISRVGDDYCHFRITGPANTDVTFDNVKIRIKLIDLTQMFGEGNEPTTVEEYEARKPKMGDEYAYNEGQVIHFNGEAIKSVGFNQFDKDSVEKGIFYTPYEYSHTGVTSETDLTLSAIKIRVMPRTIYYTNVYARENVFALIWLDKNNQFLQGAFGSLTANDGALCTSPANAYYAILNVANAGLDSFVFNLSHTGVRNGEYEPYTEHTLYLPSAAQDMKSAGTAYDEIYWDETRKKYVHVQRIGSVDLGDLDWKTATSSVMGSIAYILGDFKAMHYGHSAITSKYDIYFVADDKLPDRTDFYFQTGETFIRMLNIGAMTGSDIQNLLQGIKLIYELAEPIITEITDYEGYMDYPVSDFGTEEVLSLGNTAPLKADIQYGFNAVDTIRNNRLDITALKKEVGNANATADEAKSLAENAEDYAEQANNLSNNILDDIDSILLSTSEQDGRVTISLNSNGITVGDGEGGYETKGVGTSVQIPNATSNNYGLMSPDHVDKLNSLYKPHSIGTVTTVTELKTSLNAWLATNKGKIVAATFQCSSDWRTNWANPDKQDTAFASGSTTWTAQVIAAYSTDANHVCLMISSYSENNQCIVCRTSGVWSGIRQIAFMDSKINNAFSADNATLAEKATNDGNGNNIADTYLPKSGGKVTGSININDQLTIDEDGNLLPQHSSVTLGSGQTPFEYAHIGTVYGSLSGTATKALQDGNGLVISTTYAKADDLAAIRSALTWKPFTNNSN